MVLASVLLKLVLTIKQGVSCLILLLLLHFKSLRMWILLLLTNTEMETWWGLNNLGRPPSISTLLDYMWKGYCCYYKHRASSSIPLKTRFQLSFLQIKNSFYSLTWIIPFKLCVHKVSVSCVPHSSLNTWLHLADLYWFEFEGMHTNKAKGFDYFKDETFNILMLLNQIQLYIHHRVASVANLNHLRYCDHWFTCVIIFCTTPYKTDI